MNQNKKFKHLFLNSNPWFSAVSDYSLQLSIYIKQKEDILYCSEVGSTAMFEKCQENNISFKDIPIHNQSFINFFKSFFFLIYFLFNNKNNLKYVWTFEGREHALCSISKIIFPFLWRNKKLIRIRGQAQYVKSNLFSKFIYNKITDKVIFAAECVKKRVLFNLPEKKSIIHYYGKSISENKNKLNDFTFHQSFLSIKSESLIFLVIGRFDPVKGHDYLVESFLNAEFKNINGIKINSQLIFLGYKANIDPLNMYNKYLEMFGEGKYIDNKYYLESKDKLKQLYIIDQKIECLKSIMTMASFGVIPSLDSEVICRVGVEFMQCGIPVISSDVGALPEVFSSFNDCLYKAGSVSELTKKLEELSLIYLDKKLYKALQNKVKKIGETKFSSKNYEELINFIEN